MQEPISTADLKLGFHRGSPRLWIEGKKLKAAGFSWGSKYRIEQISDGLVISLADDGPDTVAGRTRNGQELPIIDRHESSWSQLFPSGRVSVKFFTNRILVNDSQRISRDVESTKASAWIFQANPDRYDIVSAVRANQRDVWATNQHRDSIEVEAKIYFYHSGKNAGIYATGRVVSLPFDRGESSEFGQWAVNVEYEQLLQPYVTREDLLNDAILKVEKRGEVKLFERYQGTNWPLSDAASQRLDTLVSSRNSLPVSESTVSPVDSTANKFRDSSKSHSRNQKWSREEIILALDVYMRFGLIGEQHPELQKLSNTLRDRKELSTVEVPSKYRNINGVKMKLANLASLDPGYEGVGLKSGGKLEEEIWNEFVGDQERLSIIASQLRSNPNKSSQFSHDNRSVRITDVEQVHTPEYSVIGSSDEKIASRREQKLVLAFRDYLSSKGHVVTKHVYGNGLSAIECDLFDETSNVLYEAKGTSHRMNIRLAIGQLFDYRRFEHKEPELAILVPGRPNDEIVDLCNSLNIEIVWPTGDSFISTNNAI